MCLFARCGGGCCFLFGMRHCQDMHQTPRLPCSTRDSSGKLGLNRVRIGSALMHVKNTRRYMIFNLSNPLPAHLSAPKHVASHAISHTGAHGKSNRARYLVGKEHCTPTVPRPKLHTSIHRINMRKACCVPTISLYSDFHAVTYTIVHSPASDAAGELKNRSCSPVLPQPKCHPCLLVIVLCLLDILVLDVLPLPLSSH